MSMRFGKWFLVAGFVMMSGAVFAAAADPGKGSSAVGTGLGVASGTAVTSSTLMTGKTNLIPITVACAICTKLYENRLVVQLACSKCKKTNLVDLQCLRTLNQPFPTACFYCHTKTRAKDYVLIRIKQQPHGFVGNIILDLKGYFAQICDRGLSDPFWDILHFRSFLGLRVNDAHVRAASNKKDKWWNKQAPKHIAALHAAWVEDGRLKEPAKDTSTKSASSAKNDQTKTEQALSATEQQELDEQLAAGSESEFDTYVAGFERGYDEGKSKGAMVDQKDAAQKVYNAGYQAAMQQIEFMMQQAYQQGIDAAYAQQQAEFQRHMISMQQQFGSMAIAQPHSGGVIVALPVSHVPHGSPVATGVAVSKS